MPTKKELSPKDIREIVAARGILTAKEIQKKFGIGTTRLYRIWREAGVVPAKTPPATEVIPPATEVIPPATEVIPPATAEIPAKPVETAGKNWQDVLLPQILAGVQDLQNNMALLMETQESHYEDVEDIGEGLQGLEAEVEETGEGILESLKRNFDAVRAQTDKIVGTANSACSAAFGVGQVLGYGLGLATAAFVLYINVLRPKYEEWKQKKAASEELQQPVQSANNLQQHVQSANKKGIRPME